MTGSAWESMGDDEDTERIEIAKLLPGAVTHGDLDGALAEYDYASSCLTDAIRRRDCLAVEIYASEAVRSWVSANAMWHEIQSVNSPEQDPELIARAKTSLRSHHRVLVGVFLDGEARLSMPAVTRLFEQLRGRLADEMTDESAEPVGK
jgi:hypothetical protein